MRKFIYIIPLKCEIPESDKFIILTKCRTEKGIIENIGKSKKRDLVKEKKKCLTIIEKNKDTRTLFKIDF